MTTYGKPDFICIGFEKAATTWLYKHLNNHPDVKLAYIKEFRYFNEGDDLPAYTFINRFFSKHWHYGIYREHLKRFIRDYVRHPRSAEGRSWWFKYLFYPRTEEWYSNLFDKEKVSGDITPTYTHLSEASVERVKASFPNTKIILILREPTSRLWSKLKMIVGRHTQRQMSEIEDWEMNRMIDLNLKTEPLLSDVVERWRKHFEDIEIVFFEDVHEKPTEVMHRIFKLLNCAILPLDCNVLKTKVHLGLDGDMPLNIRRRYIEHHLADVQRLSSLTDSDYPEQWLTQYKKYQS